MIIVERFEKSNHFSNTYWLKSISDDAVSWLVDVGNVAPILALLAQGHIIKGVLLTHAHYDHIEDINLLLKHFPECEICCSAATEKGLYDPKINLSFYHEQPIMLSSGLVRIIEDGDRIALFKDIEAEVTATPGHNPGCVTFKVENFVFTGDSYIPGYPVVTKLRGGDKHKSASSIKKIFSLFDPASIICPGHFRMYHYEEISASIAG